MEDQILGKFLLSFHCDFQLQGKLYTKHTEHRLWQQILADSSVPTILFKCSLCFVCTLWCRGKMGSFFDKETQHVTHRRFLD